MPAYALALTLAVTAPLLGPGHLLLRDAVSTPRSYLTDAALGLSQAAPRALPQDFFVALASTVVDGGVVVKALLILGLFLAGWGAARLVAVVLPDAGTAGQCVAVTVAIWNPYVAERLLQGHWSLLVGYGCLPWVAASVLSLRVSARGGVAALVFWPALAGLTPTGLLLAVVVAVAAALAPGTGRPRWWCATVSLAASLTAALPWLVASVLGTGWADQDAGLRAGIDAFAARAEPGLSTLFSLASLGGIWNSEAVPASRTTLFAVASAVVLLGIVAVGVPRLIRGRTAVPLLVLAALAVVGPALMATGPGLAALEALSRAVPGLGVLRDGQKWVALAMPAYALAGAAAVVTLRPRLPALATATVCCAALIATLPDLVWGVGGRVAPVRYPPGWAAAAAVVNAEPAPVAVLPVDSMRRFSWGPDAPVLDPLPRWLRAEVLSTGDLTVAGHTVLGEGAHARDVQRMLTAGAGRDELAAAGVGWVVTEGPVPALPLPVAYRDDDIAVYAVGGDSAGSPHRPVMIAAHAVWLGQLGLGIGLCLAGLVIGRLRSRHAHRRDEDEQRPQTGHQ
ncbi:hypothetical protein [Mycolicibacterium parafortuitum]|uniref:Transmembrane protein n=1 Tax=Mycolicibacterium parafortuitum TaxID=39692 RepID=A0A375YEK2_MYCPF|nr:hypothetical protein [Mycolicibacterium parafortuitum]SRX79520.1 hypothetical protein MPP7335_01257 [Mycolicibacterium parafortuitum]